MGDARRGCLRRSSWDHATRSDQCLFDECRTAVLATRVPYPELVSAFEADAVDGGDSVVSIFCLLKLRNRHGDIQWADWSGGERMTSEELLGALSGLAASMCPDSC